MISVAEKKKAAKELVHAVVQMIQQAPHDFCGEQREFYLPRMRDAFTAVAQLFPEELIGAMGEVMQPDDEAEQLRRAHGDMDSRAGRGSRTEGVL